MLQVSFDIVVDADGMDADTFMNFVDEKLYDKYHGDISPALRREGRLRPARNFLRRPSLTNTKLFVY